MKQAVVLLLLVSAATISGYAQTASNIAVYPSGSMTTTKDTQFTDIFGTQTPPYSVLSQLTGPDIFTSDGPVVDIDAYTSDTLYPDDYGAAANLAVWSQCYSTYTAATNTYSGKGQCQQATITATVAEGSSSGTTLSGPSLVSGSPASGMNITNPCLPAGSTVTINGSTYTLTLPPQTVVTCNVTAGKNDIFTLSGSTYWPYPYTVRGSNGIHNTKTAVEIQGPGMLENYHVRPVSNVGYPENGHYGVWGAPYYSTYMTLTQGSTHASAVNALQVTVKQNGSGMSAGTYGPFMITGSGSGCTATGPEFYLRVRSATVIDPIYVKPFGNNNYPTTCTMSFTPALVCGSGATCPQLAISIVATIPQGAYIGGKGIIPDTYVFGSPVPTGQTAPTVSVSCSGGTNFASFTVAGGSSGLTDGLWWAFGDSPATTGAIYNSQPIALVQVTGGVATQAGSSLITCGSVGTMPNPVNVTFTLGSTMLSQQAHIDFEAIPTGSNYLCGVSRIDGLVVNQTLSGPFLPSTPATTITSLSPTGTPVCPNGGRVIMLSQNTIAPATTTTAYPYSVALGSSWGSDVVAQLYEPAILFPFNNNALLNVEGVNARAGCRDCEVIDDGGVGATSATPDTEAVVRTVTGAGGIGVNTHDNFYLDHPQMNFLLGSLYSFGGQQIWNPFYTPTMPSQISGIRDSHYLIGLSGYYGGNWLTGQTMVSFLSPFEGGSATADDQNQISLIGGELNFYDGPMLGLSCANPAQMNSGFGIPCVRYIDFIGTHSEGGWNMGHFDAAGAINIQSPGPVVSMANANYVTFLGGALSNPGPGSAIFNELTSPILHVSGPTLSPGGKIAGFNANFTAGSPTITYSSGLNTGAFDPSGRWDGIPLTVSDGTCAVGTPLSGTCIVWLTQKNAVTSPTPATMPTQATIALCQNGATYSTSGYCGSTSGMIPSSVQVGFGGYYAANHTLNAVGWDFSSTTKYQDNSSKGLAVLGEVPPTASGAPSTSTAIANGFIVGTYSYIGNLGQISGVDGTMQVSGLNASPTDGMWVFTNQQQLSGVPFQVTNIANPAAQTPGSIGIGQSESTNNMALLSMLPETNGGMNNLACVQMYNSSPPTGGLTPGSNGICANSNGMVETKNNVVDNGSGNMTVMGTLGVTGATTLTGALNANAGTFSGLLTASSNATVGGTLGVTGATTLTGALNANAGTFSGLLMASNNATIGGTLGVTGTTTLAGLTTTSVTANQVTIGNKCSMKYTGVAVSCGSFSAGTIEIPSTTVANTTFTINTTAISGASSVMLSHTQHTSAGLTNCAATNWSSFSEITGTYTASGFNVTIATQPVGGDECLNWWIY